MIISHKFNFIFIKTNKTAGTSIEIALSKFCGPHDVITPISSEDEKIRSQLGYPGPQNYLSPLSQYGFKDMTKWITQGKKKFRFYNHISAQEIISHMGEKIWNSYFTFCLERNPWDRVISLYYHRYKSNPRPSISEFVNSNAPLILRKRGHKNYTINGNLVVDKVCEFENLIEELDEVRKHVGIPEQIELPNAKSGFRKDKRNYHDILNELDIGYIAELFKDEIKMFKYNF